MPFVLSQLTFSFRTCSAGIGKAPFTFILSRVLGRMTPSEQFRLSLGYCSDSMLAEHDLIRRNTNQTQSFLAARVT